MKNYAEMSDDELIAYKNKLSKTISKYNNIQLAKKLSLNSAYGVMGSIYFRFFDIRLAEAITTAGQLSVRWIEQKINFYMNNVLNTSKDYIIFMDTDSVGICLNDLVDKVIKDKSDIKRVIKFMDKVCEDKISPYISKSYEELALYVHAFEQKMHMKREALCDVGIWTGKKHYIMNVHNSEGVQYKEPKIKVKGLHMVQSSTPMVVRDKMKETIKFIVNINATESDLQNFIEEFRKEFNKIEPEDIAFPRSMNNMVKYEEDIVNYKKRTPIQVRGAIMYNNFLKKLKLDNVYPIINEGEKLKYIYLKTPNPLKSDVISFPRRLPKDFDLHKYIDYRMMFDKVYLKPISDILNYIGWKAEKVSTLDSFFK